jgi:hypothetical protein
MQEDLEAAEAAGCIAFLAKPAAPATVAAEVGRVLAMSQTAPCIPAEAP